MSNDPTRLLLASLSLSHQDNIVRARLLVQDPARSKAKGQISEASESANHFLCTVLGTADINEIPQKDRSYLFDSGKMRNS